MNMLRRTNIRQFLRYTETAAAAALAPKLIVEPLSRRALIRVKGEDIVPFLQGLMTNDMNHLHKDKNPSMFAMFLNKSGRVLYDSIIYRTPSDDTFLIECDSEVSAELQRHLRIFRVRRKIEIDCMNGDLQPWIVFNPEGGAELPKVTISASETIYSLDPRLKELGIRMIYPKSIEMKDLTSLFPQANVSEPTSTDYNTHRYSFGVGEGIIDHPPGKCFPLEANCDFLHGVSFHKGCYVGQELTARVYHTGVVRKRLLPLRLTAEPDANSAPVQTQAGAAVGAIRGVSKNLALALLRVEPALNAKDLMIDGRFCSVFKPDWWPKVLPTRQALRTE